MVARYKIAGKSTPDPDDSSIEEGEIIEDGSNDKTYMGKTDDEGNAGKRRLEQVTRCESAFIDWYALQQMHTKSHLHNKRKRAEINNNRTHNSTCVQCAKNHRYCKFEEGQDKCIGCKNSGSQCNEHKLQYLARDRVVYLAPFQREHVIILTKINTIP
mmetsp:Transcript_21423/g.32717  ORF Transcript_21423/g.32717 Transcript_21423/m.32717 type:complete len:158 (+) Transcript_21423:680-1153(+)